jgi:hypothetical protein
VWNEKNSSQQKEKDYLHIINIHLNPFKHLVYSTIIMNQKT